MKKMISVLVLLALVLGLTGCKMLVPAGSAEPESGDVQSYRYEYQGMGGTETAQFDLAADGSCRFYLPDHPLIQDVYAGSYQRQGDQITVTGLVNEDPAAPYPEPGLWTWIVDGGAVIQVDDEQGTFVPAQQAAEGEESGAVSVAYAQTSPAQTCDIYQPEGVENAPVIVLVHGGGFLFGDSKMPTIQPVIQAALERGYGVVSVDYRKSSEAVFPAALADVKAAVRYVKAHAEEYGFDSERIALWGESAGAYLSLMTALTPQVSELDGDVTDWADQTSAVKGFVSFYAPVEFYTLYEEAGHPEQAADSFESQFLGSDITADREKTDTTYWETYAEQLPVEMKAWIQAGDADQKVPCSQSEHLAERLAEKIGAENIQFSLIEGADHEDELFYTPENLGAVLDWLDSFMKG